MRGGALPLLVWGALLALLGAGNWVWAGDAIQVADFGLAILIIFAGALLLAFSDRRAIRPGPPEPPPPGEIETVPYLSYGAVLAAVSVAIVLFGLAFGHFAIYVGSGLFLLGAGRVFIEVRAARESRARWRAAKQPQSTHQESR